MYSEEISGFQNNYKQVSEKLDFFWSFLLCVFLLHKCMYGFLYISMYNTDFIAILTPLMQLG